MNFGAHHERQYFQGPLWQGPLHDTSYYAFMCGARPRSYTRYALDVRVCGGAELNLTPITHLTRVWGRGARGLDLTRITPWTPVWGADCRVTVSASHCSWQALRLAVIAIGSHCGWQSLWSAPTAGGAIADGSVYGRHSLRLKVFVVGRRCG